MTTASFSGPLRFRWLRQQCLTASWILILSSFTLAAQGVVPPPQQAFGPKLESALYLDLAAARQTPAWNAVARQFQKIIAGVQAMDAGGSAPPALGQFLTSLDRLQQNQLESLQGLTIDEVVLVTEGGAGNVDPTQLGEDASLLAVLRLSEKVADQDALLQALLGLLDEEFPGTSEKVLASRRQAGAAEVFVVPSDLAPGTPMPFPMSLGIGPGEQGTVMALGRTETLEAFLTGATDGELPAEVTRLMSNPGQLWIYSKIPENASETMQAATAATPGASLPDEVIQTVEQLREFGLTLRSGTTSIGMEVLLRCTSGEVAREMAQKAQGMLGMMKMMSAQQPSAVPGFVTKLDASAQGDLFRMTTALAARDFDTILQAMPGGGAAMAGSGGRSSAAAPPEVKPLPGPEEAPLKIEFLELLPSTGGHIRRGNVRLENSSDRSIREMRVRYVYRNARGARLGEWSRVQRDPLSETLVRAGANKRLEVALFSVPRGTAQVTVTLEEVTFTDGSSWRAR